VLSVVAAADVGFSLQRLLLGLARSLVLQQ
jgi:hypothetical protein